MSDILVSIHGNRVGLDVNGNLIIDGSAAAYGTNFGSGTAAAPSFAFSADTDTGLYRVSSNVLGITAAGAQIASMSTGYLKIRTPTSTAGLLELLAADNAGAYNVIITNASHGQSTTYTIPDPGAATANIVIDTATQTLTGKTLSANINADTKRCGTQNDNAGATLSNVVGLVQTVVAGTYKFNIKLSGLADGTGGVKIAFKLTTAVITSWDTVAKGYTASAVAVQHNTTTTDQTLLFDQAAAVIAIDVEGIVIVGTGGTMQLQHAQHTANGTSSIYVGSSMTFTRMA